MFERGLFDLEPLGNVANNVIDKLSVAAGWVANRESLQKVAVTTFVSDIQNSNLDPLNKAAIISNSKKIIREYSNQKEIIEMAISTIKNPEGINAVDDDWIIQFMDLAKNISNSDFQKIWALIFAKECSEAGSIPKSLLLVLQKMDRNDAEMFTRFASLTIKIWGEYTPYICEQFFSPDETVRGVYQQSNVTYDDLTQLETLGLIKMNDNSFSSGYITNSNEDVDISKVEYFNSSLDVPQRVDTIRVGNVIFTKDGRALRDAVEAKELEGFWQFVVERLDKEFNEA